MKQITLSNDQYEFLIYTIGYATGKNDHPNERSAMLKLAKHIMETREDKEAQE